MRHVYATHFLGMGTYSTQVTPWPWGIPLLIALGALYVLIGLWLSIRILRQHREPGAFVGLLFFPIILLVGIALIPFGYGQEVWHWHKDKSA